MGKSEILPKLCTPAEAAKYLGISEGTLGHWRLRSAQPHKLNFFRVGKVVRYRLSDLEEFVRAGMAHEQSQRVAEAIDRVKRKRGSSRIAA